MTTALVVVVGAFLMMVLVLMSHYGAVNSSPEEEEHARQAAPSVQERVERLIGLLNYGDVQTARDATRQLLSLGTKILQVLFAHLRRLEQRPGALSPRCQLLVEGLLVDMGLQTYIQTAESARSVHRASPIFPAVIRVFSRVGPNLVVEMSRGPTPESSIMGAALLLRMGPDVEFPLSELLSARPESIPVDLLRSAIPLFSRRPEILGRLVDEGGPKARLALISELGAWGFPGAGPLWERVMEEGEGELAARAFLEVVVRALETHEPTARQAELVSYALQRDELREMGLALLGFLPTESFASLREHGDEGLGRFFLALDFEKGDARAEVERALDLLEAEDPFVWRAGVRLLGDRLEDPRATERLVILAENAEDPRGSAAWVVPKTPKPQNPTELINKINERARPVKEIPARHSLSRAKAQKNKSEQQYARSDGS